MNKQRKTFGVKGVLPEPRFSGKLRLAELRRSSLKAVSSDDIRVEGKLICKQNFDYNAII